MSHIREWSTTAANNNSAAPDGAPEGMAPSAVNDTMREMMAQIKTWYLQAFPNHISGLTLSNSGTDGDHDIDITTGAAMDTTGVEILEQTTAGLTKRIDAAWAVGDGNGGIDTGTVAASTMYAVWLISDVTNNVVDALFSTSFTWSGVTKPSGYTLGQLIGAVSTDGSANIRAFTMSGDYIRYHTPVGDIADTTVTSGSYETGRDVSVPPLCKGDFTIHYEDAGSNATSMSMNIRPGFASDGTTQAQSAHSVDNDSAQLDSTGGHVSELTDANGQIDIVASFSGTQSSETYTITTRGFQMLTRGYAS